MKRLANIITLIVLTLFGTSCLREEGQSTIDLQVNLKVPEGLDVDVDLEKVTLRLQSKTSSLCYVGSPDAAGSAHFTVQPGRYDLLASSYDKVTRVAVNASCPEFLLTDKGIVKEDGSYSVPDIEILLDVAVPNALVIRELYYHGSTTLEGASYIKDCYVEIYNNSGAGGRTVYLDSLCLSTIFPYNSTTGNNAWQGADTLALAQMFWMFPGGGSDYPLRPGEASVIALRAAVDHSKRSTSGLQLNRAHFGAYADHLSGHEISAGVTPMVCYMAGQGTSWAVSIHSPAFILFKPEMGVDDYRSDALKWERYEPGKSSGTKYWHIAKDWIIDGVECVDSPAQSIKRLPASVDASYVYMRSPHYSGKCVTRALESEEGGIKVYQDTNNSASDFIPDSVPCPSLKTIQP